MLRVKLVRSIIGNTERNRRTVAALGLRKLQQTVFHEDNPTIRGMIHKVKHLLLVDEVDASEATSKTPSITRVENQKSKGGAKAKVAAKMEVKTVAPKVSKAKPEAKPKAEKKAEKKAEAPKPKAEKKAEAKPKAAKPKAAKGEGRKTKDAPKETKK